MEMKKRGLAGADAETRRRVAQSGGKSVSANRAHMAEIGRRGGERVSKNKEHMAEIGRLGGTVSAESKKAKKEAAGLV